MQGHHDAFARVEPDCRVFLLIHQCISRDQTRSEPITCEVTEIAWKTTNRLARIHRHAQYWPNPLSCYNLKSTMHGSCSRGWHLTLEGHEMLGFFFNLTYIPHSVAMRYRAVTYYLLSLRITLTLTKNSYVHPARPPTY